MTYRDDFREMERETYWTLPRIVGFAVLAIVIVAALGFLIRYLSLAPEPYFRNRETQITRSTNQYVTTRVQALATLKAQYDDIQVEKAKAKDNQGLLAALAAQEAGVIKQMKLQAANLRPEYLPPDIAPLLR